MNTELKDLLTTTAGTLERLRIELEEATTANGAALSFPVRYKLRAFTYSLAVDANYLRSLAEELKTEN